MCSGRWDPRRRRKRPTGDPRWWTHLCAGSRGALASWPRGGRRAASDVGSGAASGGARCLSSPNQRRCASVTGGRRVQEQPVRCNAGSQSRSPPAPPVRSASRPAGIIGRPPAPLLCARSRGDRHALPVRPVHASVTSRSLSRPAVVSAPVPVQSPSSPLVSVEASRAC